MRTEGLILLVVLGMTAPATMMGATGTLKLNINPGRAGVFIDGKYLGPAGRFHASRSYQIEEGEHELRLSEPRYEEIVQKVTIVAGKTTALAQTMKALPPAKPPFGILRIEHADHLAAVYVNSRFMGHVDEFSNYAQGLKLNPGTYEVRVESTSGGVMTKTVTIEADKTTLVK